MADNDNDKIAAEIERLRAAHWSARDMAEAFMAAYVYDRFEGALRVAMNHGDVDGSHHKAWVIDQMVRALCASDAVYAAWVERFNEAGRYEWQVGTPP